MKIAEGGVTREDFFIVTKVWSTYFQKVDESCHQSLEKLGVSYIDLLLMHFPVGYVYKNDDTIWPENDEEIDNIDYLKVYAEMEKLVDKGLVKSLGVSNFNTVQIDRLVKNCRIKPVLNEVECHPGMSPCKLIEFCKERDILVSAYCPLGRYDAEKKEPKYFFDPKVLEMAKKYNKTPFQVVIRYSYELGAIPIPKSANKSRIQDNLNIFDFQLTKDEVAYLKTFSNPENRVAKFPHAKNAEHFPFNVEF